MFSCRNDGFHEDRMQIIRDKKLKLSLKTKANFILHWAEVGALPEIKMVCGFKFFGTEDNYMHSKFIDYQKHISTVIDLAIEKIRREFKDKQGDSSKEVA